MTDADKQRARLALTFAVVAVLGLGLAVTQAWLDRPPAPARALETSFLPQFSEKAAQASLIMVTTAQESFHVIKDGELWRLSEKANHPVRAEIMRALITGLADLRVIGTMTSDPAKHERLGVADPYTGGNGVQLEVSNGSGDISAHFVLGRRDDALFVRLPDSDAVASLAGNLPALGRAVDWLDLRAGRVAREEIIKVAVSPPSGPPYTLTPQGEFGDFLPQASDITLENNFIANPVGIALSGLNPIDVKPADTLTGTPVSQHITFLRNGQQIVTSAFIVQQGGAETYWVRLKAVGPYADAYNKQVSGYAYGLSRFDWVDYSTNLSELTGN